MDRLHVVVQRSYNKRSTRYFERFILTLIVLRYIEEEKDESDPEERTSVSPRRHVKNGPVEVKNGPVEVKNGPMQRNLHNFLLTKAIKVHEHLLESLTSLLSN